MDTPGVVFAPVGPPPHTPYKPNNLVCRGLNGKLNDLAMMDSEKVLQRTSSLLQNKSFTDVTFIVGPPNSSKKYVGHRVLLAMTSPVFEAMFYGDMADKSKVIRITDIAPIGFENLLRYAYTDTLNLQTVEDAMLTAYAAKKYILPHLLRECFNFLEKSVTPKTVCQVYEFSVVLEAHFLIYQCLNVIDRQTYHVLTSTSFNNVSVSTLEMIVQRPYLNLYSEFSLYNALYMWAEEECAKRNVEPDIDNLRRSLETTMPHIRFLTMTPEEFSKGPAKSGLLTKDECFHVFMNLAVPGIVPIPRGLSSETVKRSVPPEFFSCRRYKASAYHSPVRPLRIVGLRFIVANHDIFLTGLGFPARLDSGFYSVRQPKYDGVIRYTYQIQDGKMEHEDADVNFVLSKEKDVKITLKKPFYVRKGVEGELELQLGKFLAEDVVIPSLKNRKKDDTVNGVNFQFSSFQRGQLGNMTDIMEFSEIFFYY